MGIVHNCYCTFIFLRLSTGSDVSVEDGVQVTFWGSLSNNQSNLTRFSINLLVFYHECHSLIGDVNHCLFICDR